MKKIKQKELTGRDIDAMTPAEKQQLIDELERGTPESRRKEYKPVAGAERVRAIRVGKKMGRGRPKLGSKGTRAVSVTVEVDLLRRADAFARKMGVKRAELFTQGLRSVVPAE